jgi:hypothetical protein
MPQILIPLGDDFPVARDQLRREVERLEVARKLITKILYRHRSLYVSGLPRLAIGRGTTGTPLRHTT